MHECLLPWSIAIQASNLIKMGFKGLLGGVQNKSLLESSSSTSNEAPMRFRVSKTQLLMRFTSFWDNTLSIIGSMLEVGSICESKFQCPCGKIFFHPKEPTWSSAKFSLEQMGLSCKS